MDPARFPRAPYGPRFVDDVRQEPSMQRRTFMALVSGGLLAAPLVAGAQPAGKVSRVGRLSPSVSEPTSFEAFKRGLEDRGWNLGRDLLLEPRWADEKPDRLTTFAAEMVNMKVDVIVALGDGAIEAARRATSTIPIVMAVATDAVERGFVASLARPGSNLTGLSAFAPELAGKRIQLLKELVPSVRRVGVLSLPIAFHRSELSRIETAARSLDIGVRSIEVSQAQDFDRAVRVLAKDGIDALYVQPTASLTDPHRAQLATLALRHRIPAMGAIAFYAESGFLLSYGANPRDWAYRSAYFVDRLLKGAKPADLPVEQPTKFELVINVKTARALGLTIPQSLLLRADEVIQ